MKTYMLCLIEFERVIEMPLLTRFSYIYISILIVLWVFFSIRAYQLNNNPPWGFGIVILGVLISGYSLDINNFSINLLFVLILIGAFWNINNIRQLIRVESAAVLLRYIAIGTITGLLSGFFLVLLQGMRYLQINGQYSLGVLIGSSMQVSVAEEFLFRGFLLGYLKKFNSKPLLGNAIQSLLFTAMHFSRYSDNWLIIAIIFSAGLIAGYFTLKNKSLIPAIFLHSMTNIVAVIWWFMAKA